MHEPIRSRRCSPRARSRSSARASGRTRLATTWCACCSAAVSAASVHAINPNYARSRPTHACPVSRDLPAPPDLAVLSVRNERLEETLAEAIAVGARSAVIFASGFLADDRTPPLAARLAAMARAAAMPICGGNCMGFYNDLDSVWICGFPSPRAAAARLDRVHRAFRQRVRRARAQRSAACASRWPISPGQELDDHRRRLHRLRARAAGGQRHRPLSRDRARACRLSRLRSGKAADARRSGRGAEAGTHGGRRRRGAHAHRRDGRQRSRLRGAVRPLRRHPRRDARRARLHAAAVRHRPPRRRRIARLHPRLGRRVRDVHRPRAARRRRLRPDRGRRRSKRSPRASTRASNPTIRSMRGEPAPISRPSSRTASGHCSPTTTRRWACSPPTSATATT